MEIATHGRILDDNDVLEKALERYEKPPPLKTGLRMMSTILSGMFFGNRKLKNNYKKYQNYPVPTNGANTIEDAYKRIGHAMLELANVIDAHVKVSSASSIWNMLVLNVLSQGADDLTMKNYTDFANLVGAANGAESGDIPFSLKEMANIISKETEAEKFINLEPEEALKWIQESSTESSKNFVNFMARHGHRGIKEMDMITITWGMQPVEVIKILQDVLKAGSSVKDYSREKNSEDVLASINTQLTPFRRKMLSLIMKGSRNGVINREKAKSLVIKMHECLRRGYHHLADMMVGEGMIPEPNLIFFLTHEEIGLVINTRSANIIRRAKQRLRMYAQTDKLVFPEMIEGFPKPVEDNPNISYDTINQVSGFPVSQGIVQGPARVVPSFHEVSTIQPGEILITHATDIGWSPYFPMLSGVVTEIGGLISHGAVVAREFGIPCIVGAQDATKMFKSGDPVLLDATKGILSKIQ